APSRPPPLYGDFSTYRPAGVQRSSSLPPHTSEFGSGVSVELSLTQRLPDSSMARCPGPSIVTPSPENRRASVQADGGEFEGRTGRYGAGGASESAKRDCTVAEL